MYHHFYQNGKKGKMTVPHLVNDAVYDLDDGAVDDAVDIVIDDAVQAAAGRNLAVIFSPSPVVYDITVPILAPMTLTFDL